MKARIPLLIAVGLLFATLTKAQYGGPYVDARVVIPGRAEVNYSNYNNFDRDHYADRSTWRDDDRERFYRDHRDWREDEYQRYCRFHHEFRGDRDDYYRAHYGYRDAPYCAPRRVVVYGY